MRGVPNQIRIFLYLGHFMQFIHLYVYRYMVLCIRFYRHTGFVRTGFARTGFVHTGLSI